MPQVYIECSKCKSTDYSIINERIGEVMCSLERHSNMMKRHKDLFENMTTSSMSMPNQSSQSTTTKTITSSDGTSITTTTTTRNGVTEVVTKKEKKKKFW